MPTQQTELQKQLDERFKSLPEPVRRAIQSAHIEPHMRELAKTHNLHVDQWQLLENEVMLAVLGINPVRDLTARLTSEVKVPPEDAAELALDISRVVFEPIRAELERQLSHPEAQEKQADAVDAVRTELLADKNGASDAPAVVPATPPPPPPTAKVERAPLSTSYTSSTPSHERPAVEGDPYREQIS